MSSCIRQYGWFQFQYQTGSEELSAVTNYLTRQSLVIEKIENINASGDKKYTAVYRDNDFSQRVIFSVYRDTFLDEPTEHFSVFLDYEECYKEIPSYSRWRRLDSFMYDALLCWRPQKIACVYITGGWFAGKWCLKTRRKYGVINGVSWERESPRTVPYLPPLDGSVSHEWRLYDMEEYAQKPVYRLDYETVPDTSVPYFPSAKKPQNFRGKVPYLQRDDGQAYFIFSDVIFSIHGYSDCSITTTSYTYLDKEIFFTFRNVDSHQNELGEVVSCYGFRTYPFKPELWATNGKQPIDPCQPKDDREDYATGHVRLSYPVWLRTSYAFFDAWRSWRGCQYRLRNEETFCYKGDKTPSTFRWNESYGGKSNIGGGFVAGMHARLYIDTEYPDDNE